MFISWRLAAEFLWFITSGLTFYDENPRHRRYMVNSPELWEFHVYWEQTLGKSPTIVGMYWKDHGNII